MSAAGRAYSFGMAPGSTIVPPCWWRDDISQGTCGRKNCVTARFVPLSLSPACVRYLASEMRRERCTQPKGSADTVAAGW